MIKNVSITVPHKTWNFWKFRFFKKIFLRVRKKNQKISQTKLEKKISQTKSFIPPKHTVEIFHTLIALSHAAKKAGLKSYIKKIEIFCWNGTVSNNIMGQWSIWILPYMIIIYIIIITWSHLKHNRAFIQLLICQNSSKAHYGMCFFTLPRAITVAFLVTSPLFLFIRWTRALTFFSFLNSKIQSQAKSMF